MQTKDAGERKMDGHGHPNGSTTPTERRTTRLRLGRGSRVGAAITAAMFAIAALSPIEIAIAQVPRPMGPRSPVARPRLGTTTASPTPVTATPTTATPLGPVASPTPATSTSVGAPLGSPTTATSGKRPGDTGGLPQFKDEIEFEPRPPGYKVQFSLEDADLPELIKVMGQLTGKRFIFGGKVRNIKASIYSPQKVTVAEAYQAFLSVLETNGLTVIPHGKFLKIVESPGIVTQATPIYGIGDPAAPEDRFVTRLHRLTYVTADEVANVLGHFKSRDGDITVYSPGNLLIITDTGANIKRMMTLIEEIDVAGVGDQVWVEPIHYASATEISSKLQEIFDVSKGGGGGGGGAGAGAKAAGSQSVESRVTKILAEERTNSVVIVGTEKAYLKILELIKRLDVPLSGEGEIHVLPLQHADAEELSKTLGEITGSKGGAAAPSAAAGAKPGAPITTIFEGSIRVTADKSTNSLVITSSLRDYVSLRAVIDRLDQARRQVFIEAVIMEVSTDHTNTLGVQFHGGAPDSTLGPDGGSVIIGGSNALSSIGFPATDPTSLQGLALGIRSQSLLTLTGIGLTIPAFGISLHAVTTSGDTNVLSTPHIMATDNVAAEINVGENVPLQTSSGIGGLAGAAGGTTGALGALGAASSFGGLGSSFSRQNVGTKIKLTPHINDSNEVRLEIDEEISELGAGQGATTLPRITQRNAKTQVVIQDQQTIVLGGLVRDFVSNDETKIPILGDIPLIGALFKQTSRTNQKRNLLLIITPYVIRDPADLRQIFERKMEERQEFLDRYFVFAGGKDYTSPIDYTRTRGLVEEIRQAYLKAEEKAALEEQSRPRDIKTHEPSEPIGDLPSSATGAYAAAPAAGGGPPPGPGPAAGPGPGPAPMTPAPTGPPTIVHPPPPVARSVVIEN